MIDLVDELRFGSQAEKHELSLLHEAKLRNKGGAGRNGGEHYTLRPLIRAMTYGAALMQMNVGDPWKIKLALPLSTN